MCPWYSKAAMPKPGGASSLSDEGMAADTTVRMENMDEDINN